MMEARSLEMLLQACAVVHVQGPTDRAVTGVAYHTQSVRPGMLFVALPGAQADGRLYVAAAVAAGAVAVVAQAPIAVPSAVTIIHVPDARLALAQLSAAWWGEPTRALRLVGITGTNGKTTLTYLLEAIWCAAGRSPGVIGTINYRYAQTVVAAPTTTPESYDLQALCRRMLGAQVTDVAMEVSSHALIQRRVDASHFDGAIFTNLSQDHLDYHGTMSAYAAAKRRLFGELLTASCKTARFAVVNADDAMATEMTTDCKVPILRYSEGVAAEVFPRHVTTDLHGTRMDVRTPVGEFAVQSPLVGRFNVQNLLAAIGAAVAMEVPSAAIAAGTAAMAQVPGRLERVAGPHGVTVFVDYAHTPDALRNVLMTVRALTRGRVVTVFGCGGDRDQSKRPLMGEAAARSSDVVVVTSDNPRTEDPASIIAQIVPGIGTARHEVIVDRAAAIQRALAMAVAGDVVLIAGKGHEDYQIVGTEKRHFDDREVVRTWMEQQSRGAYGTDD
ncbi:MAG: UDP-N-acetylmuramoyl-L-alanyl-D-glutamate--2,6-diaminopimelate ligase [Deltaproteobacteria bacterium]|nr:UDP-N-acetylmuramoyl-L-alanyl-D-glutamate--2,6-diaminopimelate ligase [Deltaproteobacteria bacterium]